MRNIEVGNFIITKLDKRYNGHEFFKYIITPAIYRREFNSKRLTRTALFFELKDWCRDQWGPPAKWGLIDINNDNDYLWTWEGNPYFKLKEGLIPSFNIFFKNDEQLSLFVLMHGHGN
jgi:hypothetical protein